MKSKAFLILSVLILLINPLRTHAQVQKEITKEKLEGYRKTFWDNIPKPKGWVNDYELDFNKKQIASLENQILKFKAESGIQITIVTVDTMMTSKKKFNDLALRIANSWKPGEKGKDNGILIAFSRKHRLIRICNGYGIEKLISDKETKEVIDRYIIPHFKKDDYYTGAFTGLTELIKLLKKKQ
ncbi:TPM domain-containing protein [Pedobacter sp. ISL-68]|uniref:TPM domain-containing protein n=1 Tax=unclassified Pedobacter TaxID=2628915 RepID=UPI001BE5EF0D|nr:MULTISPECIES: TPM domain-containing protein [unclassified Pedobacter]MBT2564200.1 TPM domain-containing protein [Pedobacter sp. ISL-64]MBT2591781.1 TPM domain-containing protein [Pedobacter sp. ISL-68]